MGNNHTTISELEENEGENTPRCSIFCNTFLKTKVFFYFPCFSLKTKAIFIIQRKISKKNIKNFIF